MIPLANDRFLTDSELRRLREGSYEDKVGRIRDAVLATASDHFVEGSEVEVIATHPDRAIVTADGLFFEAAISTNSLGEYRITSVSPVDGVDAYDAGNLSQYVQKEASLAVDMFLQGSKKAALEHMFSFAPYVDENHPVSVDQWLAPVQNELDKDVAWKSTLEQRESEISKLIQKSLGDAGAHIPAGEVKFRSLHECTDRDKLQQYSKLVLEDVANLSIKLTSLWEDASEAQSVAESAFEEVTEGNKDPVLSDFSVFVTGLVEGLQSLGTAVDTVRSQLGDRVAAHAKLHDMLIERLRPYEMGTQFAVAVAQRLEETA
jgi:hypothetical protein